VALATLDMPEEDYSEAYVKHISTWDLIMHSQRARWIKRKKFKADTVEEFVLAWDRHINKIKGEAKREREKYMADRIVELGKTHGRIMCILELERMAGIRRRLGVREGLL
jgi:pheromone shutdown protein TraB